MARTLLIIDDDTQLVEILEEYLANFISRALFRAFPRAGLQALQSNVVELVILDVMLPERRAAGLQGDPPEERCTHSYGVGERRYDGPIVGLEVGAG